MSPEAGAGHPEPFLSYRCPRLRSKHLRAPCEGNLARVKGLRDKYPQALLGPMEHCLGCQGRELVILEQPAGQSVVKPTPLLPKNRQVIEQNETIPQITGQTRSLPEMAANDDQAVPHLEGKLGPGPELIDMPVAPQSPYHMFIEQRTRAFLACGHANWLRCPYCKKHDAPEHLMIKERKGKNRSGQFRYYHKECARQFTEDWRKRINTDV